jgi:hypothetical protein
VSVFAPPTGASPTGVSVIADGTSYPMRDIIDAHFE